MTKGKEKQLRLSLHALTRDTGARREDAHRWLVKAGHDTKNLDPARYDEYMAVIAGHRRGPGGIGIGVDGKGKHVDSEGLSWLESKQKQESRKLKRENDIAERVLADAWMTTEAHHEILASFCAELEMIPDKVKVELSLSVAGRDRVQKFLDEARFNVAEKTKKAFLEGKRRVTDEAKGKP